MAHFFRCLLLASVAAVAIGCGNSEPTGPKENLGDKDKQQIKELNQQRQSEWGSTNKKPK